MPTFEFNAPDGKTYSVEGPDGSTPEQAFAILNQQLGNQSAPVTAGGMAKQFGVDAARSAIGLAGMPADLSQLAAKGYDTLRGTDYAKSIAPVTDKYGSAGIQKAVEGYTGEFRKPQNRAEEIAGTAGSFAPLIASGPGGLVRKVATNIIAPTAGVEAAKAADLGPVGEVAGAVIGGGLASKVGRTLAETKSAIANAPGQDIKAASQDTYKNITANTVAKPIQQSDLDSLIAGTKADLNKQGLRPSVADKVHNALD